MRQALAKSARKKLRQIVGQAGIASIDAHDLAIQQLAATTAQGLKGVDDRRQLDAATSAQADEVIMRRLRACEAVMQAGLLNRLRWLIRGQ